MQGHPCWGDHHPTQACMRSARRQLFTFRLAVLGVGSKKVCSLLDTGGNPLPQLVCVSACRMVRLLKAERNREKPSGSLALIFTLAVLKIGVTSPERQNWADGGAGREA